MRRIVLSSVVLLLLLAAPASGQFYVAGHAGWGFNDAYRFGAGATVHYGFPAAGGRTLALGGRFTFHNGRTLRVSDIEGNSIELDTDFRFLGGSFGVTVSEDPVFFGLGLDAGAAWSKARFSGGEFSETSSSESRFALAPGGILAVPLGNLLVGVDGRYWSLANYPDAFALYGFVAVRLGG